ncbi:MAG: DUF5819 family protein [Actinomycetota bacterium]|nr:DUF5819 family protein [Actinomycetota bacterium]
MPTKSRPQIGLVLVIVAIAVFQIFSVTFAALPTNKVSARLSSTTEYLNPYFTQNWRLFAPNPIAEDNALWFRGEYVADGQTRTTDWIDWTSVELDLVHHKIVGGRAGYTTSKMVGALNTRYFALNARQRQLAADDRDASLAGNAAFRKPLVASGGDPELVDLYLRYETAVIRLGTSVLRGAHPDTTFTAVRYRIVRQPVVPYEDRNMSASQRRQVRPPEEIRRSGWRKPILSPESGNRTVADFLARHR